MTGQSCVGVFGWSSTLARMSYNVLGSTVDDIMVYAWEHGAAVRPSVTIVCFCSCSALSNVAFEDREPIK
jgi:hypothetical protein